MTSEEMLTKEDVEKLLLPFYPEKLLPKYVTSVQAIAANRSILKQLPSSDFVLSFLTGIVLEAIAEKKRFRQLDCLKVLRAISKNRQPNTKLTPATVSQLFKLYQSFVFAKNEQAQWCVSVLIKDRPLLDDEIDWLMSNYKRSTHIVNRLLLYPINHPAIASWAKGIYKQRELVNRSSQLLALHIQDDIPDFVKNKHSATVLWAIYHARIANSDKDRLLAAYCTKNNLGTVLEIALKLQRPNVIEHVISQL